ncbi:hypothetical protein CTI14_60755, partial [Methylobacterium radiotolerans]
MLVQLFIWFFGLPQFGVTLPAFACGVLGLGMYSGAYVSEIGRLNPQRRVIYHLCRHLSAGSFGARRLLVQLFIWFFGLPQFGVTLPAFACGVLGLGMYS